MQQIFIFKKKMKDKVMLKLEKLGMKVMYEKRIIKNEK